MLTTIEIVILMMGFVAICLSFFVGNKEKNEQMPKMQISEETKEQFKKEMDLYLDEKKEQTISETEGYLNRKSNEKIMEFDEFSSQILEKINHNHEEVVFMYQMLSEKEEQLKKHFFKGAEKKPNQAAKIMPKEDSSRKESKKSDEKIQKQEKKIREEKDLNAQMLALYEQGKSVLEISKLLHVGQGEVKLIISLYGK